MTDIKKSSPRLKVMIRPADTFSFVGSLPIFGDRSYHTATLLSDGTVLIAGGKCGPVINGSSYQTCSSEAFASAEVFDPDAQSFTVASGSMITARSGPVSTLLSNAKVLIAGGQDANGTDTFSMETYDPASQTFSAAGNISSSRPNFMMSGLSDGLVFIAGGSAGTDSNGDMLSTTESDLYNPSTQSSVPTGSFSVGRASSPFVVLSNGKVFFVGGVSYPGNGGGAAEIYDPSSQTFIAAGATVDNMQPWNAVALQDGTTVLVIGTQEANIYQSASHRPIVDSCDACAGYNACRRHDAIYCGG